MKEAPKAYAIYSVEMSGDMETIKVPARTVSEARDSAFEAVHTKTGMTRKQFLIRVAHISRGKE